MIEVVFSDSIKGSMKVAKKYNKEDMLNGTSAYIGESPSKIELERMFEGEALGGNSSDVIGVCLFLDIGKISDDLFEVSRKKLMFEMAKNPISFDKNDEERINKYWNDNISDLNRLKECARNGKRIRIWYSNAPFSICGFHYVISILKHFSCNVSAIKLPEYIVRKDGTIVIYKSWGEINPGKFHEFVKYETEISQIEMNHFASIWTQLKSENSDLRAIVNGKLKSVNNDFYDYFIRMQIPDNEFVMSRLIGNVLGVEELTVTDWWIAQRINNMIDCGELVVVSDNEFEYKKVLKKSCYSI